MSETRGMRDCGCGCSAKILSVDSKGRSRKFLRGHNNRVFTPVADARAFISEVNAQTVCAHCGAQPVEWHNPEHVELNRRHMRISAMVNSGCPIPSIREELVRCTPLCRRCHMVEDGRLATFVIATKEPSPCLECSRVYKPLRHGLCARCETRRRRAAKRIPCCSHCGMQHEPDDTAHCIEGHGDDEHDPPTG